jgi:hypothetical protein
MKNEAGEGMQRLHLALVLVSALVGGCGSQALAPSSDMAASGADLSVPKIADLAMRPPVDLAGAAGRIFCGTDICNIPMVCCYRQAGAGVGASCGAAGSCGDGGVQGSCDGPEDCTTSSPNCCLHLALSSGNNLMGGAVCTADCPATGDQGGGTTSLTTKLCHTDADCAGYMGTVKGFTLAFNNCCSRAGVPAEFCAPPASLAMNAYTCP